MTTLMSPLLWPAGKVFNLGSTCVPLARKARYCKTGKSSGGNSFSTRIQALFTDVHNTPRCLKVTEGFTRHHMSPTRSSTEFNRTWQQGNCKSSVMMFRDAANFVSMPRTPQAKSKVGFPPKTLASPTNSPAKKIQIAWPISGGLWRSHWR